MKAKSFIWKTPGQQYTSDMCQSIDITGIGGAASVLYFSILSKIFQKIIFGNDFLSKFLEKILEILRNIFREFPKYFAKYSEIF